MGSCSARRTHIVALVCYALLLLAPVSAARAQETPPPYLAVVEGAANVDREGDVQQAVPNMPVVPGDRVTTLGGRVEILFPDGSALDLDHDSSVELLTPIRVNLSAGRAIFVVPGEVSRPYATRYEIDTPVSTIVTSGFGTYRADATSAAGSWPADVFDQWAEARYAERGAVPTGQYLPQDLRAYSGTFDRNGSWQYDTANGYVWYPSVAPDWRPYYNGFWEPLPRYGWTWIGTDVWAWPTHHYGRWGYSRTRWFWIPGRTFAPAWVSWGAADGFVSWCPLGFDNRPVFGLSAGFPSRGWVVVPRATFGGHGSFANRYALQPNRIPPHTAFIAQTVPPVAVPRDVRRRAALAAPGRANGAAAARSMRTDQRTTPLPATISRAHPIPSTTAVPRAGIQSPRSVPDSPPPGVVNPQQPMVTAPGLRSSDGDGSRARTGDPNVTGSTPDQRRSISAAPRALPPPPAVAPRVQSPVPPPNDAGRSRAPAPTYGAPHGVPAPGYTPPQATPASAAPTRVVPPAAPRTMSPVGAPAAAPRAMPPPPASSPAAAPPSPPAAHPAQPAPSRSDGSEGHASEGHAHPAQPAPSRSGGSEDHAGAGHAQGRRRG